MKTRDLTTATLHRRFLPRERQWAALAGALSSAGSAAATGATAAGSALGSAGSAIGSGLGSAGSAIGSGIGSAANAVGGAAQGGMGALQNLGAASSGEGMGGFVQGLYDGMMKGSGAMQAPEFGSSAAYTMGSTMPMLQQASQQIRGGNPIQGFQAMQNAFAPYLNMGRATKQGPPAGQSDPGKGLVSGLFSSLLQ